MEIVNNKSFLYTVELIVSNCNESHFLQLEMQKSREKENMWNKIP